MHIIVENLQKDFYCTDQIQCMEDNWLCNDKIECADSSDERFCMIEGPDVSYPRYD